MAKQPNYTDEMTTKVVDMYVESGKDNSLTNLQKIGEEVGRSAKSIRAKLVKEGAYVVVDKSASAPKDEGPSKKDLVNELVAVTGLSLEGIEGANKPALKQLVDFLAEREAE